MTPGPWKRRAAAADREPPISADVHGRDGGFVADCGSHEHADANARAIEAIPEMLEALRYYAAIKGPTGEPARVAIARADCCGRVPLDLPVCANCPIRDSRDGDSQP